MMSETKKYRKPVLKTLGSIQQITAGSQDGAFTDAAFPQKTPMDELTFSY